LTKLLHPLFSGDKVYFNLSLDKYEKKRLELYELLNQLQGQTFNSYQLPTTDITWGFELEFTVLYDKTYDPAMPEFDISRIEKIALYYKYHVDWKLVYEMTSSVLAYPLRKIDVMMLTEMEALASLLGYRVSDYDVDNDDVYDKRTCGSHLHFRVNDRWKMARMANWLAVLSPFLIPLWSLQRELMYKSELEVSDMDRGMVKARSMFHHYTLAPKYITSRDIAEADMEERNYRGYDLVDENEFYAVELNKYRKNTVTIEVRVNEQHPLAVIAMLEIADELSSRPVPIVELEGLYQNIPIYPVEVKSILYPVKVIKPSMAVRFLNTDGQAYILPLLENLQAYIRKKDSIALWALHHITKSRGRMTYSDYTKKWIEIVEAYELKDWIDVAKIIHEMNLPAY
jgi:hypothetical protein